MISIFQLTSLVRVPSRSAYRYTASHPSELYVLWMSLNMGLELSILHDPTDLVCLPHLQSEPGLPALSS